MLWMLVQDCVLNPALNAHYKTDQERRCLEETRVKLLEKISDYLYCSDKLSAEEQDVLTKSLPELFWLCGMAGSGKSSVATTVAADIEEMKDFSLTCFFCQRDDPGLSNPKRFFPTLAYRLSQYYASYQADLVHLLRSPDGAGIHGWDIATQYKKLLGGLLPKVTNPPPRHVVVVDALDECGKPGEQKMLAECLVRLANAVPWIKVFVTSRPEPGIRDAFLSSSSNCEVANINEEPDTSADIRRFLEAKLEELRLKSRLSEIEIDKLAEQAAGLFIWCSTLFRLIEPRKRKLQAIRCFLSGSAPENPVDHLYVLYDQVLDSAANPTYPEEVEALHVFLGTIYVSAGNRPLSMNALAVFLRSDESFKDDDEDSFHATKDSLHAVLFEDSNSGGASRVHHPSFLDYIRARLDDGRFSRNLAEMHKLMFRGSLTIMNEQLRFNICGLEDASVLNEAVRGIEGRISASISEELQYGSLFGFQHLFVSGLAPGDDCVRSAISAFLHEKSLYWLEVMSLLKAVGQAAAISYGFSRFFSVSHAVWHSIFANDKNAELLRYIVSCIRVREIHCTVPGSDGECTAPVSICATMDSREI